MSAALRLVPADDPDTAPPSPADWEAQLVGLLGAIDHIRTRLSGRAGADAARLLTAAEEAVAAAETLAAAAVFPPALGAVQAEAMGRAGTFFTAAREARDLAVPAGLVASARAALFGRPAANADAVRAALLAAHEAIAGYFTLFTRAFPSSATARGWVDAASVFLAEFKQQVRDLPD